MTLAVWSFWSAPFRAFRGAVWLSERHHLLSWILSVETARRHYGTTALLTDAAGADLLIGELQLPFSRVSTELDLLDPRHARWWTLGKLRAYAAQSEPFVHIDSDVFLWERLPDRLSGAAVLAQNPERFTVGSGAYRPDLLELAFREADLGLPVEWSWYAAHGGDTAACCGVFGGSDLGFIAHYADAAAGMALRAERARLDLARLGTVGINILVEQYFLSACSAYHALGAERPRAGLAVEYLFPSAGEAYAPEQGGEARFTHLIAAAKRDPVALKRLDRRVQRHHPVQYMRLCRYLARRGPSRG